MIFREICEKYRSDLFIVNQFSDVFSNTFQNLLRIFSIVVIFPSHQMAFQILSAVSLLTIMDTFLEERLTHKQNFLQRNLSLFMGVEHQRSFKKSNQYVCLLSSYRRHPGEDRWERLRSPWAGSWDRARGPPRWSGYSCCCSPAWGCSCYCSPQPATGRSSQPSGNCVLTGVAASWLLQ